MPIALSNKERVDELELQLRQHEQSDCPLDHLFTPGLYTRQIFMPANTLIVSKKHMTCHPFIVSKGIVHVKVNENEWQTIEAPYRGITMPGTRRVLLIEEDCVWTTFHALPMIQGHENGYSEEDQLKVLDAVEDLIIEKSDNPLLQPLGREIHLVTFNI